QYSAKKQGGQEADLLLQFKDMSHG
ncbi:hypothetical protein A2U01_0054245, partial [Trifolium medium]|nr:hypothetical protein [Trifolium medium]